MRRYLFLFIVLIVSSHAIAADTDKTVKPLAIYILPTQLIDIAYDYGLNVGAEIPLFRQFALTGEYCKYFAADGFMARANLKYYFKHSKDPELGPYLALEYGYKDEAYQGSDNIRNAAGQAGIPVKYEVYKFVNTATLKYGALYVVSKRLYFDFYAGLGIKYKVAWNSLTDDQISSLYHWHEGDIDKFANCANRGYTLSLSLGLKIGYRFK